MRNIRPKQPRLQLAPDEYRELHRKVLQRDSWRCQACGSMERLEVHHIELRSQGGEDREDNLITLCRPCHENTHKGDTLDRSRNPAGIQIDGRGVKTPLHLSRPIGKPW